ncbi:MAG: hypothetical protein EOP38_31870 [Rubrivivax sp.]|nr:MAG: hypothetical protein EOP38_31870 [Rubrivivax sp.]
MTKKKLLDDIKQNPSRIYRAPADVMRDRRLGDAERLEILRAWRGQDDNPEITTLIAELEQRFAASGHAAE